MAEMIELDELQEIIDEFMVESNELISQLDTDLVKIEKTPDDLELLNRIFRSAHTIKGTSGFLGFSDLSSLTHKMEDVLNKLRKAELKLTPEAMDTLLECVDCLRSMLSDIADNGREVPRDLSSILAKLDRVEKCESPAKKGASTSKAKPAVKSKSKSGAKRDKKPTKKAVSKGKRSPKAKSADEDEEVIQLLDHLQAEETQAEPEDQAETDSIQPDDSSSVRQQTQRRDLTDKKKADTTIRVDVKRLDNLMNMMGELVLGRNSLVQLSHSFNAKYEGEADVDKLNQSTTQISFITTELQMAVMKMRMLPIGNVFNKFPRVVRDLSRDLGKQIDLEIRGEETELDKSVIEEIGDPLVHLIRNSCDHGIEPPDERKDKNKPPRGKISLIAEQEGSHIVIRVSDDGRGLDLNLLTEKALEKGLVAPDEVKGLSDSDKRMLIFHPGFSTAKKVTDVSGRGVGMDVVRTNIERLSGTIEIESAKDVGTSIIIKLPLTLAIVQGLLVRSDQDVFAIPLSSVLETVRLKDGDIQYINKREVIRLRDIVLPIVNLGHILDGSSAAKSEKPYVVVVGLAEKRLGLLVDDLMGQEEVVIKSLGDYLGSTPGIAGATIMGDGRIRLIIDIGGLFNLVKTA